MGVKALRLEEAWVLLEWGQGLAQRMCPEPQVGWQVYSWGLGGNQHRPEGEVPGCLDTEVVDCKLVSRN